MLQYAIIIGIQYHHHLLRKFNSPETDRHILLSLHDAERHYIHDELHDVAQYRRQRIIIQGGVLGSDYSGIAIFKLHEAC
jgi:hypothetical protein